MIICPKCTNKFSELDGNCHRCLGSRMIKVVSMRGPKGAQTQHEKMAICPRCNGAGTEQANFNRNNRKRGASNEYKALDVFGEWWLKFDGSQYEWRKTPQSGGSALAAGFDMAGDICTTAPNWPFHVEAKRTQGWDFGQLLNQAHEDEYCYGDMGKFIKQVFDDVPKDITGWKRIPLLYLNQPGPSQPTYVMLIQRAASANPLGEIYGAWQGLMKLTDDKWTVHKGYYRYTIMNVKLFTKFSQDNWLIWTRLMMR